MATHSSTLAWKILWMEEPGRVHQHPHRPLQPLVPLASLHWEGPEEALMPRLLTLLTAQPSRAKG